MVWTNTDDPPWRHTYEVQRGRTDRILYGDNVRYGGIGFDDSSGDPSDTWTDVSGDPSDN